MGILDDAGFLLPAPVDNAKPTLPKGCQYSDNRFSPNKPNSAVVVFETSELESLMEVVADIESLEALVHSWRRQNLRIGVVPTMGALHPGHLSLVDAIRPHVDRIIATIFVNPTQFAPHEDLAKYPRTLPEDLKLLEQQGVDVVFTPLVDALYPAGFSTFIEPPQVAKPLEGEKRPTHFRGVATIVVKLLNLCRADMACFGQKDYQQAQVIRAVVRDLNLPCQILIAPIVREADGLAMSSRNRYLSPGERQTALVLSQTLREIRELIQSGERDGFVVTGQMQQSLIDGGVTELDYAVVADPQDLTPMDPIRLPCVLLVAAFVGQTRLIDNEVIGQP